MWMHVSFRNHTHRHTQTHTHTHNTDTFSLSVFKCAPRKEYSQLWIRDPSSRCHIQLLRSQSQQQCYFTSVAHYISLNRAYIYTSHDHLSKVDCTGSFKTLCQVLSGQYCSKYLVVITFQICQHQKYHKTCKQISCYWCCMRKRGHTKSWETKTKIKEKKFGWIILIWCILWL